MQRTHGRLARVTAGMVAGLVSWSGAVTPAEAIDAITAWNAAYAAIDMQTYGIKTVDPNKMPLTIDIATWRSLPGISITASETRELLTAVREERERRKRSAGVLGRGGPVIVPVQMTCTERDARVSAADRLVRTMDSLTYTYGAALGFGRASGWGAHFINPLITAGTIMAGLALTARQYRDLLSTAQCSTGGAAWRRFARPAVRPL